MPKPVKKPAQPAKKSTKPSADPNIRAHQMMAEHARLTDLVEAELTSEAFEAQYRERMRRLGRKGGKVSGAKRMEMPVEERRRIASLAARAMWAKRKGGKKR